MTRFANLLGELSSLILLFAIESLSLIFIEIESTRINEIKLSLARQSINIYFQTSFLFTFPN